MRIVLAVVVLAITLISAEAWSELKLKLSNNAQNCKESSQVDPDLITKAQKGEFVEDPKYMNYTFCLTKAMNILDAEGNFKEKNLLTNLLDNVHSMLKSCEAESEKETGNGKRSFIYLRCLQDSFLNDVNMSKNAFD
ncbi:PREDICTED: uncharacterized protein LOC108559453 [Nicrophorus vespilloides]|uniref:Uncharacterized protein LOC108559453 n=1 Tax=Nicrophorus vespilloides TaxID=110193 RepID=A0ABM1MCD7_NICVS|nr:PREDICTED: uncharacterized protein LOC108559453 [Nicrophorus vespilloides]